MKHILLLPLLLLASCSGGNKIVQISCTFDSVQSPNNNHLLKPGGKRNFHFNSSTGEAYEYFDSHEKLVLVGGVTEDKWGGKHKSESIVVNNILKIDVIYTPKLRPGESPDPDLYEHRIDLKDLTIKEKLDSGVGREFDYTATGSCKYTKPKTTEIFRDN